MKHYLFEDLETGEEFIVGACDLDEAKEIAVDNFEKPKFQYQMSEFEAQKANVELAMSIISENPELLKKFNEAKVEVA